MNQSDTFISDREFGSIKWIQFDESNKKNIKKGINYECNNSKCK